MYCADDKKPMLPGADIILLESRQTAKSGRHSRIHFGVNVAIAKVLKRKQLTISGPRVAMPIKSGIGQIISGAAMLASAEKEPQCPAMSRDIRWLIRVRRNRYAFCR
jgi:hypothetical protein